MLKKASRNNRISRTSRTMPGTGIGARPERLGSPGTLNKPQASENRRMANKDKLQFAKDNAYELFERQWIYAMSWIERREEITYTGPSITEAEIMVDDMVSDILDGMESL